MSKTYVSQQFFNHRHKIYQKKNAFLYTEPKKSYFYSHLKPKNAFYVKGFVISNIYINIRLRDLKKKNKTIKDCYFVDFIVIKYIKLS